MKTLLCFYKESNNMTATIYRYLLDPTGVSSNNLVVDEEHQLSNRTIRCVAPKYGGFYATGVIVKDAVTGIQLVKGKDYSFGELFEFPTGRYGQEIFGILIIKKTTVTKIKLTYQALGGEYSYSMDAIISMSEYNRFSKGIFGWIGFRTYWLPYKNVERVAGETKWNFWKLTKYAIDGIINFSQAPLSAVSGFGVLMTVVSFLMLVVVVGRKLIYGDPVAGWASTICVIIFIGGLQLFCLGVIGHYIAKMYLETKQRPHFIISETNDEDAVKLK